MKVHIFAVAVPILGLSCGDHVAALIGDAMVDAGHSLQDAAAVADASTVAAGDSSASATAATMVSATCATSSDGSSRVAVWSLDGVHPATTKIHSVKLCGPVADFGPPEARAQDCSYGNSAYVGLGTLVVSCLFWSRAEVELEL